MIDFWNERYSMKKYVYGEEPNVFFAEELNKIKKGKIILPCEGEGRNAAYAATKGWSVQAFDSSSAGKFKAMQLANKWHVTIDYEIADASLVDYPENSVDVVAFIYAHFPASIRKIVHQKAIRWLKPGGKVILEAFNPLQIQNGSGGPKDPAMLYSEDMLREDFEGLDVDRIQFLQTTLQEGEFHQGKADVIRLVGSKVKKDIK